MKNNNGDIFLESKRTVCVSVPSTPEYAVEIQHQGESYYRFDQTIYKCEGDSFVVVNMSQKVMGVAFASKPTL